LWSHRTESTRLITFKKHYENILIWRNGSDFSTSWCSNCETSSHIICIRVKWSEVDLVWFISMKSFENKIDLIEDDFHEWHFSDITQQFQISFMDMKYESGENNSFSIYPVKSLQITLSSYFLFIWLTFNECPFPGDKWSNIHGVPIFVSSTVDQL
jgi:hypothetical protein